MTDSSFTVEANLCSCAYYSTFTKKWEWVMIFICCLSIEGLLENGRKNVKKSISSRCSSGNSSNKSGY